MTNIRITRLRIVSSSQLEIDFTASLDSSISMDCVSIVGAYSGTPDLLVTSISISSNVLTVNVRPMISGAYYQMTLTNIIGARGEQFIEDGKSNVIFFVGQVESSPIRDTILDNIPDVYNKDSGSVIFNTIDASAKEIEKASNVVGTVKSAGYVSIEVADEEMTRGSGPFDRFANEGVFQIIRVGSTPAGGLEEKTISYDSFPSAPVSLQQEEVLEEDVSNTSSIGNSFVGLTITLSKSPIIIVNSVTLIRGTEQYIYDIEQYRYGIINYKYDPDNAYPALDLNENQLVLNSAAVGPTFPFPQGSDSFIISYYYKKEGRIIESDTLSLTRVIDIVRESVPALATTFFLNHAPIVDENGNIPTRNGVVWLDPQQNFNPNVKHPAFITELLFNQYSLPSLPGQFSVDYNTGRVFVFGVDGTGTDGTTIIPPVADYSYLKTYQNGLDYIFYSDLNEVASIPDRDLRGYPALINFEYEDTYAEGTDFSFNSHVEVINERVENRLIEDIGIYSENYPINEVFRIYNETTGELYNTTRISNNEIYFSAATPPKIVEINNEAGNFENIIQSQIVVLDRIIVTGKSFIVFKIELSDANIGSAVGCFVGASFNSSLVFSDHTRFSREFFYDPDDSLTINLARLEKVGDYMVDYNTGTVYLAQLSTANTEIGDATYKRSIFKTKNAHIIRATDIFRSPKVGQISKTYSIGTIEDSTISVTDIDVAGEREISVTDIYGNTTLQPIQVESDGTIEVMYDIYKLYHIFQITDLQTSANPIDFSSGAVVSSSSLDTITLDSSGVSIIDNDDGYGLLVQAAGSRVYFDASRISDLVSGGYAELISAISAVDTSNGTNYFSFGSDGYVDSVENRVYLPTAAGFALNRLVVGNYRAQLRAGAAVLVDYSVGDVFINYAYTTDEILINYEYGDNVLDWSISDSLSPGETYYVTYRYGALRNSLRDNFGVLTGIDELSTIPDDLDRETYRHMVEGSLQSFPKGPTILAIKDLVKALTQIDPNITETVFLEWILGRDFLHLEQMGLDATSNEELPGYAPGKFGDGLILSEDGQTATIPATSNIRFNEGTWESFVIPNWSGIENDAYLTFNLAFDGNYYVDKIFIGSNNEHPSVIPFGLSSTEIKALGKPSLLHTETGYFIWYDIGAKKWRFRVRAPVGIESRVFSGTITTDGELYDVTRGATADGYDGYEFIDGYYNINEFSDRITSTDTKIRFSFALDAYDAINNNYDAYDNYGLGVRGGFDGLDFSSDKKHYFFDTGVDSNYCRMSLFKDGKGFLRFRVYDGNKRVKMLSANIHDWQKLETHHIACSWKIGTIEQRDELHLFIDGAEIPNSYRYRGYFEPPQGSLFLDPTSELLTTATSPTIGGFNLQTVAGSNIVTSLGSTFASSGVSIGDKFEILDDTEDGINTRTYPYVFVQSLGENYLTLKTGLGVDYNATLSLENVSFSVNPLQLITASDNDVERVRVFVVDSYSNETELNAPGSLEPQYEFSSDGYVEYVNVYDGVGIGENVILKSYGLMQSRCKQQVFIWSNLKSNIINTIMPQPTAVNKVNITKILAKRLLIDPTVFALIATDVGGHIIPVFYITVPEFCQPSNTITGRQISANLYGDNIDWSGVNNIIIDGLASDGYTSEIINFSEAGTKSTEKYFTYIADIFIAVSPIDPTKSAGSVEIRETHPINWQENDGNYAQVFLSVQQQAGINGVVSASGNKLTDGYSRFGAEDIGKIVNVSSPSAIANVYRIKDVDLDPSGTVKDSDTIELETYAGGTVSWPDSYSNIYWKMLTTSYGDSGFANGLITLEIAGSGGQPFLLESCWYEIDFPTYLQINWPEVPKYLFTGSDLDSESQANAVIDELRILDELSVDTGKGAPAPSSGRSITTDSLIVRELEPTIQTLGLFHFDDNVANSAGFYSSFSPTYNQSENSVNSSFKQSAIFNKKVPLKVDNKSIFNNNSGTIEFWVSPILDTYNDPTKRYFIDLTPAQQITLNRATSLTQFGIVSDLLIVLPIRARSIDSVNISNDTKNYFTGGTLSDNGYIIRLGQALPKSTQEITISYVPITSTGDRFSLYKNESGALSLLVTASDVDYQIQAPIYWKKNTWHRIFVGWSLNNADNQDRLVLMVDGTEAGIVRYGTGLKYGSGFLYGSPTVWGSANAGTISARNILADINLTDIFNVINIGADFTGQFPAMSKIDNLRISSEMRQITYLGGSGPGQLIGKDILYTSNVNTAQPVVSDAITRLLLDFDTTSEEVEYLATVRNMATGIFDFYVEVFDTFGLIDSDLAHEMLVNLINQLKPAHTRAFVSFTK